MKHLPNLFLRGLLIFMLQTLVFGCKPKYIVQKNSTSNEPKASGTTIPFYPLRDTADLDILIKEVGNAQVVLMGESTHGTSDFYKWRTEISKRLIQEKGFDFIAVEGDWGDGYLINNFIQGPSKDTASTIGLLKQLKRWPTWLWANYETASLVNWLNRYNQQKGKEDKVGFYGLDVFAFWQPIAQQMPMMKDTTVLKTAKKVKGCFEPYGNDALAYMKTVNQQARASCEAVVNTFNQQVQKVAGGKLPKSEDDFLLEQEALLAVSGERYFRNMLRDRVITWNTREHYMAETITRLLAQHKNSKAIIWAHNTHVGDAHYADTHFAGKTSLGELLQNQLGAENVFIIGFSSYSGSFIAAQKWGDEPKIMEVPAAVPNSFEAMLHKDSSINKIVLSKDIRDNPLFKHWVINRAMGVVNDPWQLGTSIGSLIPQRYDAFIYIDHMNAVHPFTEIKERVGKAR
jgi:erythromycin esterase